MRSSITSRTHGRHAFWLDVTPGFNAKVLQHLDRHLISEAVELVDQTEQSRRFTWPGRKRRPCWRRCSATACPTRPSSCTWNGRSAPVRACHHSPARSAWDARLRHRLPQRASRRMSGESSKPPGHFRPANPRSIRCGSKPARRLRHRHRRESLCYGSRPRVAGRELFEGLLSRPGTDRHGPRPGRLRNRAFLGVNVLEGGPLPAGTKLYRDATEVGVITSSTQSPRLHAPLALGYIRRGNQEPGTSTRRRRHPTAGKPLKS